MAHCTFMWPIQVLKTSASVMVRPPPKSTGVFDGVMPALRIAHDSSSVLGPRAIIALSAEIAPRRAPVGLRPACEFRHPCFHGARVLQGGLAVLPLLLHAGEELRAAALFLQ